MNSALKNKLLELKQEHLIDHYQTLNDNDKLGFLENLTKADLNKLALAFSEKITVEADSTISEQDFAVKSDIFSEDLYNQGLNILKNNKAAMLIMAGGMGSRLGFDGAKGAFMLTKNKSVFEIHVDKLHAIYQKVGVYPLLLIMCSDLNINYTSDFFEKNNYFNYPKNRIKFFVQGNLPAVSEDYKILLESKTKLKEVPDGNGGIFDALNKSGLLNELKKENVKWLHVAGVDNVLLDMLDPVFLAFAENSGLNIASKSVKRIDESEKVGIFALKNNKPAVLEYTEVAEALLKEKKPNGEYFLSEANIASHLFNIESEEYQECLKLPFHKAYKKIAYFENDKIISPQKPNAYKFEQFIFDAFKNFDEMAVLSVDRDREFAALKNKEGKDSIASAREAYLSSLE